MRFRGVSVTTVGAAAALLLTLWAPEAGAQRGRLGVLRPAPRPNLGFGAARPRVATLSPHFFSTCLIAPFGFSPFFGGGFPFVNIQILANNQPAPDPTTHLTPDPSTQPVPFPGSHPVPVPTSHAVPAGAPTSASGVATFASPVYSAPVYTAPVYGGATPIATPRVSGGMVVGEVVDDPSFGLWGGEFFFGGGVTCLPTRFLNGAIIVR